MQGMFIGKIMKSLLKSKIADNKSVDELIDEYLKELNNNLQIDDYLAKLIVYIQQNYDIDKDTLLSVLGSKIETLSINIPTDLSTIYARQAIEASSEIAIKYSFDKIDTEAIKALNNSFIWLKDDSTKDTQDKLKKLLTDKISGNIDRSELIKQLKKEFETLASETNRNVGLGADMLLRQSSSVSKIIQAQKYGYEYFEVVAKVDDRTTPICISLNGRRIPTKQLYAQAMDLLNATSIEDRKKAVDLSSANKYFFDTIPSNIGMPPYHFGCRTTIRAIRIYKDTVDTKEIQYSSYTPNQKAKINSRDKEVVFAHYDKTGVERVVTIDTLSHSKDSDKRNKNVPKKEIIAGLNSIREIAPHKDYIDRVVAKSDNGYFFVFQGKDIVTFYRPSDGKGRTNKKKLDNHFDKNAITNKKVVLKWKKNPLTYFLQIFG